jgi:hypothetical protein
LPSLAEEQGQPAQMTHSVTTYLVLHFGPRLSFRPSYAYYGTPSYNENRYMAEVSYRFSHE